MNQLLNLLFPDEQQMCLLCHRPLLRLDKPSIGIRPQRSARPVPTEEADTDMEGVCLFCLQEAKTLSERKAVLRRLRVVVQPEPSLHTLPHPHTASRANAHTDSLPDTHTGDVKMPQVHVIPVLAAATYEGLVRTAIRQWKYDGTVELTPWFAKWMGDAYRHNWQMEGIVPVPSSLDRYRKRGYDHVYLLAHKLGEQLGLPVWPVLLRHSQPATEGFTQSQTAKTAQQRLLGLQGAYVAKAGVNLTGKRVLLVDDIVTTGSTLHTCAQVLYQMGAMEVAALVIAHVE